MWIRATHGVDKVPGKGSGKVDTVPSVLAPHEAVLNKAAAEKLGRGKIARLNAEGNREMGRYGKSKPKHYAEGSEDVERTDRAPSEPSDAKQETPKWSDTDAKIEQMFGRNARAMGREAAAQKNRMGQAEQGHSRGTSDVKKSRYGAK